MGANVDADFSVESEPATELYAAVALEEPSVAFTLHVIDGVDQGRSHRFDGSQPSRVLVGHSPTCDVCLSDRTVSRRHASLDVEGSSVKLTDLDSTNGTRVDGVTVVEARLQGGETISIGATRLRLDVDRNRRARPLSTATRFGRLLGASIEMRRLYPLCERLAQASVPVVIEGDTGTGKELLAESLHEKGPRASGPFIVFDCTTVPPNLLEAELFGHERGAFTGAVASRNGVFEQATGGTLLIDEIGELPLLLQPKLLRAIERGEVRPIGAVRPVRVDVRVIAATRRDLDREVQAGRFRDDLFHRLAVGRIELPPLARRRADIAMLARHFCRELGGDENLLPPALLERWQDQPFFGNVRELRNTVARHLALGELASLGEVAAIAQAPEARAEGAPMRRVMERAFDLPFVEARQLIVGEFERRYVERMLARHAGNVTHAAETAGVARRYFQILKARRAPRR